MRLLTAKGILLSDYLTEKYSFSGLRADMNRQRLQCKDSRAAAPSKERAAAELELDAVNKWVRCLEKHHSRFLMTVFCSQMFDGDFIGVYTVPGLPDIFFPCFHMVR